MMIKNRIIENKVIIMVIFWISLSLNPITVFGQISIQGPTTINAGEEVRYEAFIYGPDVTNYTWYPSGGNVISQSGNSAIIRYGDTGSVELTCVVQTTTGEYLSSTITITSNSISGPPNPTISSITCSDVKLVRTDAPDTDIAWYWQGKNANGKSVSLGSGPYYTADQGSGRYYIRAFDNIGHSWSDILGFVDVIVPIVPNIPPNPNTIPECGSATISWSAPPPVGESWYWQSSLTGTNTSNTNSLSSITLTGSNNGIYYLRARNNSSGCWSEARTVSYYISPVPDMPPMPAITTNCGETILTMPTPPSNHFYRWQTSATGEDFNNDDQSVTLTTGTTYYLKSFNTNDGCWSLARVINYLIDPLPRWYADTDGDGFGDPAVSVLNCTQPAGYVSNANDKCPNESGVIQGCVDTLYELSLSTDENYVFTRVYQEEMSSSGEIKFNKDVIESITYFDGLGRPIQQNAIKGSSNEKDIVTHITYDDYGRQDKQYLPFESQGVLGSYKTVNINTDINAYYQNKYTEDFSGMVVGDVNAYSQSSFEPSPLNRVKKQAAPGKDWKAHPGWDNETDHAIKFDWGSNVANEVVYFKVTFPVTNGNTDTEAPTLVKEAFYAPNELNVTITKDENWQAGQTHPNDHTIKEYKDKLGRVVLKRTYNENNPHDTYYVYDDFGNLTYVIPPKVDVDDNVDATELSELCYQYKYDHRNRLIEKKIPGKGWEYIVYDKVDRPILTQDANQRTKNEWLFTTYDVFDRVAYTGKIISNASRTDQQGFYNSSYAPAVNVTRFGIHDYPVLFYGAYIYYSETYFHFLSGAPSENNIELLTANYYDTLAPFYPGTVMGQEVSTNVKGLATRSEVKVLGTQDWVYTYNHYDEKGRLIHVHTNNNYLKTKDILETKLDFVGKVLKTHSTHTKGTNTAITTTDTFTYDHVGRLLTQTQKINDQIEEVIVENTYDELGQLESKEVGGGLQTVDYTYNVRGWLKGINDVDVLGDDLFSFKINYNSTEIENSKPLYNGNISETHWKTVNDNILRNYHYKYDALNRLKQASFILGAAYSSSYNYDKNGNIKNLIRFDARSFSDTMDNLTYTYDSGNKLLDVVDSADRTKGFIDLDGDQNDYEYDVNGNLIKDVNKKITNISYNHLNLPISIEKQENSSTPPEVLNFVYDALGNKIAKRKGLFTITKTEYAGNYIYETVGDLGTFLKFLNHPEGYIEPKNENDISQGFEYIYQYKDHLGNIRLSYADSNNDGSISVSEILEENNYYPFGLQHKGYNNVVNGTEHPYKFQGVEYNESLDLNLYEMDWRQYDPAIGRFTSIDPFAEERDWLNPYNFVQNNPVIRVDPSGLLDDYGVDQNGKIELIKKTDDDTDTLYSVTRDGDGNLNKDSNGEVVKNDTNGDGEVANGDSVTVEKGVLNNIENTTYTETNKDGSKTKHNLQILDVTNASTKDIKSIFEFSANNSNNEFAYLDFENGNKFISTTFLPSAELSAGTLIQRNGKLRHHVHSHPFQGFLAPSPGDVSAAGFLHRRGHNTRLEIYAPVLNEYQGYNRNSPSFSLDPVIISAPKKKKN